MQVTSNIFLFYVIIPIVLFNNYLHPSLNPACIRTDAAYSIITSSLDFCKFFILLLINHIQLECL